MQEINKTNLDLRSLSILLAVAELDSMQIVAAQFGVNQSSISHTINKLREQLNDPLFYRAGRNVKPTKFLLDMLPSIRAAVLALESLPKHSDFEPQAYSGRIVIAANVSELLPEARLLHQAVSLAAPLAQLHFIELGSRENLQGLLSTGKVDLALTVRLSVLPATLQTQSFLKDSFQIYYDPSHRAPVETLEDYRAARHAVLDFGGTTPSTVDQVLSRYGVRRNVVVGVPNVWCLSEFIRGNDLVCTMQSRLRNSAFSDLAWCQVPFEMPDIQFDMAWHRRDEFDPKLVWLRKILSGVAERIRAGGAQVPGES